MARTDLTPAELKQCLATGAAITEVQVLQQQGFTFAEILDLCETARDAKVIEKESDAERSAKATKKAMRPENEHHPGISVYSRPKGEVADPKGDLVCKTLWAGTPLEPSTLTAEEVDLVNAVADGAYRCTRSDGTPFKVEVVTERSETGQPSKKTIFFATRGQLRHNLPGMVPMLREMHAQSRVASPA